jgi:hypothetical protein
MSQETMSFNGAALARYLPQLSDQAVESIALDYHARKSAARKMNDGPVRRLRK